MCICMIVAPGIKAGLRLSARGSLAATAATEDQGENLVTI